MNKKPEMIVITEREHDPLDQCQYEHPMVFCKECGTWMNCKRDGIDQDYRRRPDGVNMVWQSNDKRPAPDNPPSGGSSGKVLPDTPVNVPMPPVKPTLGSRDEDWKTRAETAERMLRVEASLAKQLSDVLGEHFRMFDMIKYLNRQRAFSERAFGPGPRAKGIVDHIRKELVEIEADPGDLKEWIDVVTLALDGAWRAGFMPQEIVAQLNATLKRNEARTWPDWRTVDVDKAIEHDRSVM